MGRTGKVIRQIALIASLNLTGCGASGSSPAVVDAGNDATTDTVVYDDLIARVYDTSYSVPDGFFVDERADTDGSYTAYHVKDHSVSYELCSDDYHEALAWEELDNASRAVNGVFLDSHENQHYFEFVRELSYVSDVGNIQGEATLGFARVFKCSSVNRTGVDRNLREGFGGTLNEEPLTPEAVRNLTEYLWQFEFFEASARKVLASVTTETNKTIEHTLRLAFLFRQASEQCDRIEVFDWSFSTDRATGDIERAFHFRYALEARRVDGVAERCLP